MDSTTKILHIFGRMNRGGAEMRTLEVIKYQREQKIEQHFCVLTGLPGVLDDEIRSLGGKLHYLPLNVKFFVNFIRLIRQEKINVVHSHVQNFSGLILALAAWCNVPVRIAHFRNTDSDHPLTLQKRIQYKFTRMLIDRYATDILSVCVGAMEQGWKPTWRTDPRCKVIYNGFDASRYSFGNVRDEVYAEFSIKSNHKLIIHVGRLDPAKNHRKLASVFFHMTQALPDIHLLIVGLGGNTLEAELRRFFKESGIESKVSFAGLRNDVPRLLSSADMMIFPSQWEGLPGALIEARLTGLPVVASNLPGVQEIADVLDNVVTVDLALDDSIWAKVCIDTLNTAPHTKPDISNGPFDLDTCAAMFVKIWTRNG